MSSRRLDHMHRLLDLAIKRSSEAPLDITLVSACRTPGSSCLLLFFKALIAVSRRWRRVAFTVTSHEQDSQEVATKTQALLLSIAHNIPLLEKIIFDVNFLGCPVLDGVSDVFSDAPSLVSVGGFQCANGHFDLPWAQLRQLGVFSDPYKLEYLTALNDAPRLQKLWIMNPDDTLSGRMFIHPGIVPPPRMDDVARAPSVRELDTNCGYALWRLALPNLHTLRLRMDIIANVESIEQFVSRSACSVQTLSLYETYWDSRTVLESLIPLFSKSVRHLEFAWDHSLWTILNTLENPKFAECFPMLESFCFSGSRWVGKDIPRLAHWIQRRNARFPNKLKRIFVELRDCEGFEEHAKGQCLAVDEPVLAWLQACECPTVSMRRVPARKSLIPHLHCLKY